MSDNGKDPVFRKQYYLRVKGKVTRQIKERRLQRKSYLINKNTCVHLSNSKVKVIRKE